MTTPTEQIEMLRRELAEAVGQIESIHERYMKAIKFISTTPSTDDDLVQLLAKAEAAYEDGEFGQGELFQLRIWADEVEKGSEPTLQELQDDLIRAQNALAARLLGDQSVGITVVSG